MRRPRVLVLPNDRLSIYVRQGNLSQFIERFEYYADNFCDVYILNVDNAPVNYEHEGIKIIHVEATGVKPFDLLKQVYYSFKYARALDVSFTRALEGSTFIKAGLLGLASKLAGKKFVCSIHGTYRGLTKTLGYKWYHKLLFRPFEWLAEHTADVTFVIDPMYIDELKWNNMHLVPNFVDAKLFAPKTAKKKWAGVYVGQLIERKGISYLVAAAEKIFSKTGEKIAVIGHGPLSSSVRSPAIDYLGSVAHGKLPFYYNASKLFVTATLHEGFAIPIVESQACGIPVVATDLPPFHNNTLPGRTSILVPAKDANALADAVFSLVKNEPKRRKMGASAREFVLKKFSKESVLTKEISLIRQTVGVE
ncbi:glycosyltransferase family 4 protein [Candidatus Micrarchaeota archaeon]|nr:glycosyltransferase family 4 protein [Candidatus Micrarchaeota archaeon]